MNEKKDEFLIKFLIKSPKEHIARDIAPKLALLLAVEDNKLKAEKLSGIIDECKNFNKASLIAIAAMTNILERYRKGLAC
jgi:hypothetical protein